MKYVDVHSHLADERFNDESRAEALRAAIEKNITFFLQGGVSPVEWQRQRKLIKKYPQNIGLGFGLHPYFVAENDEEVCDQALDILAQMLPEAMALGETGLDFRPHIMKESEILQIMMFESQIELAKAFKKPLILHIVQAHDKAVQIFDLWGAPPAAGFVHAFTGSFETAKRYIDKGFLISVGGAVTYEKNRKLHDCVKKIPLEYLLIESDSPDQAPEGWPGLNQPASIYRVAETIALIRNISAFDVLETSTSNFKRLFSL